MKTSFVFPGQGSQFVGMGRDLYASSPAARAIFDEADKVLGYSLSKLCFEGPEEKLNDTEYAQPAILTVSVAYLEALREKLRERAEVLEPAFLAGHSLGEYTALVAAGSVSFADGLRLVAERGRLMKEDGERTPGGMAAVIGLSYESSCQGGAGGQLRGRGGYRQLELAGADRYFGRGGRAIEGDGPGAKGRGCEGGATGDQHRFALAFDATRGYAAYAPDQQYSLDRSTGADGGKCNGDGAAHGRRRETRTVGPTVQAGSLGGVGAADGRGRRGYIRRGWAGAGTVGPHQADFG